MTAVLGGMSTVVASYLARTRGSNEPELSITRVKDLEQFIRECEAFRMDHGHVTESDVLDKELDRLRGRFEELLGNANGSVFLIIKDVFLIFFSANESCPLSNSSSFFINGTMESHIFYCEQIVCNPGCDHSCILLHTLIWTRPQYSTCQVQSAHMTICLLFTSWSVHLPGAWAFC